MKRFMMVLLVLVTAFAFINIHADAASKNRLFSRLFALHPKFYNSPSQVEADPKFAREFEILDLVDERDKFIGEKVFKEINVEKYNDFWDTPVAAIIITKIKGDLQTLTGNNPGTPGAGQDKVAIQPTLEVLYPSVTGAFWVRCQAKVRLRFRVTVNEKEVLNQAYEETYITDGTDKGYEGKVTDSIENFANTAIGMSLRMALDKFYLELKSNFNTM